MRMRQGPICSNKRHDFSSKGRYGGCVFVTWEEVMSTQAKDEIATNDLPPLASSTAARSDAMICYLLASDSAPPP
jgi:hypothetical protein